MAIIALAILCLRASTARRRWHSRNQRESLPLGGAHTKTTACTTGDSPHPSPHESPPHTVLFAPSRGVGPRAPPRPHRNAATAAAAALLPAAGVAAGLVPAWWRAEGALPPVGLAREWCCCRSRRTPSQARCTLRRPLARGAAASEQCSLPVYQPLSMVCGGMSTAPLRPCWSVCRKNNSDETLVAVVQC